MRKMYAAAALGAVAIVAVFAASGAAAKGPLKVHGKVSVLTTPINTTDSQGKTKTTSVTVTGKVKAKGACLSGRKITFIEVTPSGSYVAEREGRQQWQGLVHGHPPVRLDGAELQGEWDRCDGLRHGDPGHPQGQGDRGQGQVPRVQRHQRFRRVSLNCGRPRVPD